VRVYFDSSGIATVVIKYLANLAIGKKVQFLKQHINRLCVGTSAIEHSDTETDLNPPANIIHNFGQFTCLGVQQLLDMNCAS